MALEPPPTQAATASGSAPVRSSWIGPAVGRRMAEIGLPGQQVSVLDGGDVDAAWSELYTEDGAHFDKVVDVDAAALSPMVSWGTNPAQVAPFSSGRTSL